MLLISGPWFDNSQFSPRSYKDGYTDSTHWTVKRTVQMACWPLPLSRAHDVEPAHRGRHIAEGPAAVATICRETVRAADVYFQNRDEVYCDLYLNLCDSVFVRTGFDVPSDAVQLEGGED